EGVGATGAADVIRLALVTDRHGAQTAGDDALVLLVRLAQTDALARAADHVIFFPDRRAGVLVGDAVDEAIALGGRVHLDLFRRLGRGIDPFERQNLALDLT